MAERRQTKADTPEAPPQPVLSATEARSVLGPMLTLLQRFVGLDAVLLAAEVAEGRLAGLHHAITQQEHALQALQQQREAEQQRWQQWQDERAQVQAQLVAQVDEQRGVLGALLTDVHRAEALARQAQEAEQRLAGLNATCADREEWLHQIQEQATQREREAEARVQAAERRLEAIEKRRLALVASLELAEDGV